MVGSDSLNIQVFRSPSQGTEWERLLRTLWTLPFFLCSCIIYGVIAVIILLFLLIEVPKNNISVWAPTFTMGFLVGVLIRPILDVLVVVAVVCTVKLVLELLNSLRNLLTEFIVFGTLSTLIFYQAPIYIFAITVAVQFFGFCVLALSADFETPLKRWIKVNFCTENGSHILAGCFKLNYFRCSNPMERKVCTTHLFFTDGKSLNAAGLELEPFTLSQKPITGKVTINKVGPHHTQFAIEGMSGGIIVPRGQRSDEVKKEILECIAHNPSACFVKELRGSSGKYWSMEEYPTLLNSRDIYLCRFPQTAAISSAACGEERDLDLFAWMGKYRKCCPTLCEKFVGLYVRYTSVCSGPEGSTPSHRRLYFMHNLFGVGFKISWRSHYTPLDDGVLML